MNKRLNSSCMIQPLQHMKGSYQNMQNQKIPSDTWWENEQQQTSGVKRGLGWKVVTVKSHWDSQALEQVSALTSQWNLFSATRRSRGLLETLPS